MRSPFQLAVAAGLLLSTSIALATDANLDPSFGSYGWTILNPNPAWDVGYGVAVQPDGRIVVGGGLTVARYTAAGALDGTFGAGGIAHPPGTRFTHAAALQSDGAILLAGNADSGTPDPKMSVVRLDASGAVDGTFGTGGVVEIDLMPTGYYETATGITVQADGRIVVVGWMFTGGPTVYLTNVVAVRLLSDGTLDGSFGTGGVSTFGFPTSAFAEDVAVQPDGKVVIGGYQYVPYPVGPGQVQAFLLLRLRTDGLLDTTFNGNGIVVNGPRPEGSALGYAVALQPDGKILLGGHAGFAPAVLRYLSNGSADGAFGVGGIAQTVYENNDFAPMMDLELRGDGKIVLVGAVWRGAASPVTDTAVVRFNDDGSLDTTFTPTGRARVPIGPRQSAAFAAAQQADGKIVVTGYQADLSQLDSESDTRILVARFGGSCGDAFLDAGEQCDDGNTIGTDCCSVGCGFDPAGQFCNADASLCTYDTCDGAGTCLGGGPWPGSECLAVTQPLKSTISIKDDGVDAKDKISFKWSKGSELYFFGAPSGFTDFSLCVFGGATLASEHEIPSGPGWTSTSKGWKLKRDPLTTPGGIYSAQLKGGAAGRSSIKVKGKGPLLGAPSIPLTTPVTAQLVSSDGRCFGASYATPTVNGDGKFKAKGQ